MKSTELVVFVKKALADGWGYVLGAQGEMYTKELAEKWTKSRNKPSSWVGTKYAYFLEACAKWFGHVVADCSGLIIAAFRTFNPTYQDQSANTLYSRCASKGPIKTIPETPGAIVWRDGHIGVYIGGGYAIEARGYKYGVVKTKVKDRNWTNWGLLRDVDYGNNDITDITAGKGDDDMIKKGDKGTHVKAWQNALLAAGQQLPKYGADGDFGSETESATKGFQQASGLPQTGVVDTQTAAAMWTLLLSKAGDSAAVASLQAKINAAKAALG